MPRKGRFGDRKKLIAVMKRFDERLRANARKPLPEQVAPFDSLRSLKGGLSLSKAAGSAEIAPSPGPACLRRAIA